MADEKRFFPQGEYKQAVKFFEDKLTLPTKEWTDLKGEMHQKAFTVAGVMRTDILEDFKKAVDKAVKDNISLKDFQKEFDEVASKWQGLSKQEGTNDFDQRFKKKKYAAWRSRVIYQTNIQTSFCAARERQMRDAVDKKGRPLFTHAKYVCMNLETSRKMHKDWDGTVLPINHPWWQKHSPPNGWFCKCRKDPISKYEIEAGIEKETTAPTPPESTEGIDKGWEHNVGNSAYGKYESQEEKKAASKDWDEFPQSGIWKSEAKDFADNAPVYDAPKRTPRTESVKEFSDTFMSRLKEEFGSDPNVKFYDDAMEMELKTKKTKYPIYINPSFVGNHFLNENNFHPERTEFINYFIETIKNPCECRLQFEVSKHSGLSSITAMFYSRFKSEKKNKNTILAFRAINGRLQFWTTYVSSNKIPIGSAL